MRNSVQETMIEVHGTVTHGTLNEARPSRRAQTQRGLSGTLILLLAVVTFLVPGCKKKRASLPPQTLPPTATSEPERPRVESLPPPKLPPAATTTAGPPPKPKTHHAHKPTTNNKSSASVPSKPPVPTPSKSATPDSLVISPDVSRSSSTAQRQNAEQLLASAENNINRINRSLNDQEQSMRQQVNNYIQQSRRALQDGDVERGYNLALKANLLSTELTK